MNPKTIARVKQLLAVGVMFAKITQAEADAVNVLLDARAKEGGTRGVHMKPRRRIVRLRDA